MNRKGPQRDAEKERFWRETIRQQRRSGQSVREYCRDKGYRLEARRTGATFARPLARLVLGPLTHTRPLPPRQFPSGACTRYGGGVHRVLTTKRRRIGVVTAKYPGHVWHVDLTIVPTANRDLSRDHTGPVASPSPRQAARPGERQAGREADVKTFHFHEVNHTRFVFCELNKQFDLQRIVIII